MKNPKLRGCSQNERYNLEQSPLAQNPTQKKFAELLGFKKDKLERLVDYKNLYIIRRSIEDGKKVRNLVYPFGRLRSVHEKLKFHLNKVKQPDYMYSPRKGRSQRDNAILHLDQIQFLRIDIKQFYPSTSSEHIYRWARYELKMREDVAGLFTHLVTVDGVASFGSPLTPVLCTLVYRKMFDKIAAECRQRGLKLSLWVDDITISGKFVPGVLVAAIREIIRTYGLRSHKLRYATGSRHVAITGIMVKGGRLDAPMKLHDEIKLGYSELLLSDDRQSVETAIDILLSRLGRYRYIVGKNSELGKRTSSRMSNLRQRKKIVPVDALDQVYNDEPPPSFQVPSIS